MTTEGIKLYTDRRKNATNFETAQFVLILNYRKPNTAKYSLFVLFFDTVLSPLRGKSRCDPEAAFRLLKPHQSACLCCTCSFRP